MNQPNPKGNKIEGPALSNTELSNSGVAKILLEQNKIQKQEIKLLKRSLKLNQNEFETLRGQNHQLDKKNSLLHYQLDTSFIPEILKFAASAVGAGLAVGYYFEGNLKYAITSFVVSLFVYGGILLIYRKKD